MKVNLQSDEITLSLELRINELKTNFYLSWKIILRYPISQQWAAYSRLWPTFANRCLNDLACTSLTGSGVDRNRRFTLVLLVLLY